jgi:hypothetical protein
MHVLFCSILFYFATILWQFASFLSFLLCYLFAWVIFLLFLIWFGLVWFCCDVISCGGWYGYIFLGLRRYDGATG